MSVAVLARYGRSFRLAGRLLPGEILHDAASLYAFCRAVDDLADEATDPVAAREALLALRQAVIDGDRSDARAEAFMVLQARHGVTARSASALIDTVIGDLQPVRLADEAALLAYAYGAAGTVGEMMSAILGVRADRALPHAVDLGMAMQLTNIARDVIEDADRDRIYLPASWLPAGIAPSGLGSEPDSVFRAVRRLLEAADRLYRSGERGYADLPPRVRPAIRAASRLYEEIGLRIMRLGPAYLAAGRCIVPAPRRAIVLVSCLLRPRYPEAGMAQAAAQAAMQGPDA